MAKERRGIAASDTARPARDPARREAALLAAASRRVTTQPPETQPAPLRALVARRRPLAAGAQVRHERRIS
jgi:hypothetical protein